MFNEYLKYVQRPSQDIVAEARKITDPGLLADCLGSTFLVKFEDRQQMIEILDGEKRLEALLCIFRREIDRARLDVELLGHGQTVGHVLAEVALGGARHHDADRIVARGLAEDADERAVLAAAVAVDDAFGAAAFEQVADKGDAVFKFFCVISHDFHSVSFVTPGSCPEIQLP